MVLTMIVATSKLMNDNSLKTLNINAFSRRQYILTLVKLEQFIRQYILTLVKL